MRNLKLVDKVKWKLENIDGIRRAFVDPNASHLQLYLRTERGLHLYNCELNTVEGILKNPSSIIDWDYLALNNEICIACDDGEVTVVNLSTNNTESVTFCDGGIERMCWSPDQEVVVFVTSGKNVVVMNCTYDPIAESSLLDDSFGDQEFITVGWGKKETQFHGSEGKAAAKKKSDFIAPEDLSSLKATTNITWRGDGEYFAISFLSNVGRTFKVYNKEGQLQFTAEKLNDLGEAIAWRPSGNWIAAPHRLPNKYTIGLFEKNGLRHREIVLPFKYEDEPVVNLCWSDDSDVLAIETLNDGKSNVYLYTIGNYHWYLKQTLNFQEKVTMCQWDTGFSETKKLHVLLESGVYLKYRWIFEVCTSIGNRMSNLCIAAVIDGNKALLTDFRYNIVPPPMAKYTLKTNSNINAIGFVNDPENPRQFFIVTADGKLSTYSVETQQNNLYSGDRLTGATLLKETALLDSTMSQLPLYYNHWIWLNEDQIVFCDSQSSVFLHNMSTGLRTSKQIAGQIVVTCPVTQSSFFVHLSTGDLLLFKVENDKLTEPKLFLTLPEYCEHLQAITVNDTVKSVALKDNQNLYLDDTKLSTNVTSFFTGERYFAYTQLTSMKFIDLTKLPSVDLSVVSERRIERGAKLIAIVPKDSTTVLQMPRGNLEAVQPRVLSLQIIGELLDASQYEKAMLMLRKQRINLNIIFDHNPKKFTQDIDTFLKEIANAQWLNLFLAELENEDYTRTKYASNYESGHAEYPENFTIDCKITFICDFLCDVMKSKNDDRYIQPMITCFVKKGELDNALDLIWSLKKAEMKNDGRQKTDDALRYLLYMADVNELYKVALGMYNFQLVLLVADKSQKDPKEYIPFLRDLNKLEENYRKFKIDDYLKRYEKAFENIANCGKEKFNECLRYVEKHNLYTVALQKFETGDEECYQSIAISFADYLRTAGKIENAGIMYERGGDYKQAITSAKHVLDADRCLMLAKLAGYDAEETKNLALSLVPGLQSNSRYEDAFNLLKEFGDSFEDALCSLLEGRFYLKAIFEARRKSDDLIEKLVKPNLESYAAILRTSLQSDKDQFLKHTTRLKVVRLEKAKRALDDDYVAEGDLISETTSVASRYTGTSRSSGKTFRSSKNRRKHERKLLNLKEGGKFEDIALIDALYKQVQHIFEQQQQIQKICKAFIEVRLDGEGRAIQALYRDLLNTVKNKLDEIWTPEMLNAQETMFGGNLDYAQVQSDQHNAMIPPQQRFKPALNIIEWEHVILK